MATRSINKDAVVKLFDDVVPRSCKQILGEMKAVVPEWAWRSLVRDVARTIDDEWDDLDTLKTWIINEHTLLKREVNFPRALLQEVVKEALVTM